MSTVMREVWKCDRGVCGHEWFKPGPPPKSCAKCKVKNWDIGPRGPIAREVMESHGVDSRSGRIRIEAKGDGRVVVTKHRGGNVGKGRERGKGIARKKAMGRKGKLAERGLSGEAVNIPTPEAVQAAVERVGRRMGIPPLDREQGGGLAHAPNCRCFRCKPPVVEKGGK